MDILIAGLGVLIRFELKGNLTDSTDGNTVETGDINHLQTYVLSHDIVGSITRSISYWRIVIFYRNTSIYTISHIVYLVKLFSRLPGRWCCCCCCRSPCRRCRPLNGWTMQRKKWVVLTAKWSKSFGRSPAWTWNCWNSETILQKSSKLIWSCSIGNLLPSWGRKIVFGVIHKC